MSGGYQPVCCASLCCSLPPGFAWTSVILDDLGGGPLERRNTCQKDFVVSYLFFSFFSFTSPRRASARYADERNQFVRCTLIRNSTRIERQRRTYTARGSKRTRRLRRVWTDWFDDRRRRHRLAGTVRRPHACLRPCKRSLPSAYEPNASYLSTHDKTRSVSSGDEDDEGDRARLKSALGGSEAIYRSNGSVRDAEARRASAIGAASFFFFNFRYLVGTDCLELNTLQSVNYTYIRV